MSKKTTESKAEKFRLDALKAETPDKVLNEIVRMDTFGFIPNPRTSRLVGKITVIVTTHLDRICPEGEKMPYTTKARLLNKDSIEGFPDLHYEATLQQYFDGDVIAKHNQYVTTLTHYLQEQ